MQLKIVVLSGGSKKWCFDRLESDMMIFCEWLMEGVNGVAFAANISIIAQLKGNLVSHPSFCSRWFRDERIFYQFCK